MAQDVKMETKKEDAVNLKLACPTYFCKTMATLVAGLFTDALPRINSNDQTNEALAKNKQ
jgi:hypothetical protein